MAECIAVRKSPYSAPKIPYSGVVQWWQQSGTSLMLPSYSPGLTGYLLSLESGRALLPETDTSCPGPEPDDLVLVVHSHQLLGAHCSCWQFPWDHWWDIECQVAMFRLLCESWAGVSDQWPGWGWVVGGLVWWRWWMAIYTQSIAHVFLGSWLSPYNITTVSVPIRVRQQNGYDER